MLEFYRENLKYYVKIALYRYLLYLMIVTPPFGLLVILLSLLRLKLDTHIINIAVVSVAIAPVIIGGFLLLMLAIKAFFITAYSLVKEEEESARFGRLILGIVKRVANPKLLFAALLLLVPGYLVYTRVFSQMVPADRLNEVMLSLALTLIIYIVLGFIFLTRHRVINLIKGLWEILPGTAWRILVGLGVVTGLLALFAVIYLFAFTVLVPILFQ